MTSGLVVVQADTSAASTAAMTVRFMQFSCATNAR
jgi:hypothetical protein